ncbi:cell division protein PerM [Streptomyces sp. NPDC002851]
MPHKTERSSARSSSQLTASKPKPKPKPATSGANASTVSAVSSVMSSLFVRLARSGRTSSAVGACFVGGALAAGLGVGALTVLVMAAWMSSPYPDSGPSDALNVAAALWLLAHGTELVRTGTLSGVPAPMGVTPLLLVALPVALVHRAARDAVDAAAETVTEMARAGRTALWGVVGGYLAVGGVILLYAGGGALRAEPLSAVVQLPVVAVLAAAAGVWTAYGRPRGPLPSSLRSVGGTAVVRWVARLPVVRQMCVRRRVDAAVRAAGAGVLVLLGGGGLLVGVSLAWHMAAARESFLRLTDVGSGLFAVLLLAVLLVPNAAVWGAAYALGPGFVLGAGRVVGPLEAPPEQLALPPFPLLAAVPRDGVGASPLVWAVVAVGLAAGVTVARFVARAAVAGSDRGRGSAPVPAPATGSREREVGPWAWGETAWAAGLAAVLCGVAFALLAAFSGGPLGVRGLAEFGPVWWQCGTAAAVWAGVVGVPGAVGLRAWWLRGREVPAAGPEVVAVPDVEWRGSGGVVARVRGWWGRKRGGEVGLGTGSGVGQDVLYDFGEVMEAGAEADAEAGPEADAEAGPEADAEARRSREERRPREERWAELKALSEEAASRSTSSEEAAPRSASSVEAAPRSDPSEELGSSGSADSSGVVAGESGSGSGSDSDLGAGS